LDSQVAIYLGYYCNPTIDATTTHTSRSGWLGSSKARAVTGKPARPNMAALTIESLFGVKGYVALVTGGSSGLGFMISKVRCFGLSDRPVIQIRDPPPTQRADMKLSGSGRKRREGVRCCFAFRTYR
jgi:hypothetical protein